MVFEEDFKTKTSQTKSWKKLIQFKAKQLLIQKIKQSMLNLVPLWQEIIWQMMDLQPNN